jgi:hypothetical protein
MCKLEANAAQSWLKLLTVAAQATCKRVAAATAGAKAVILMMTVRNVSKPIHTRPLEGY